MDFEDIFSASDILGMFLKQELKENYKKLIDGYSSKDVKLAVLNLIGEICDELKTEISE